MLTGKSLRLNAPILGIQSVDGQRTAVMIPESATVQVVSGPHPQDRMVDVLWEGQTISVFAEDIWERTKEARTIRDERSASA